jgi:hypothetical protein
MIEKMCRPAFPINNEITILANYMYVHMYTHIEESEKIAGLLSIKFDLGLNGHLQRKPGG